MSDPREAALEFPELERYELRAEPAYAFDLNRRQFVAAAGAGIFAVFGSGRANAQQRGGREGGGAGAPADRLVFNADGTITVMTSKVEVGQGSRTELTQAAAEELRVAPEKIRFVMADSARGPNDGGTAGSRTTPSNVPAIRRACAAAREALVAAAAAKWQTDAAKLTAKDGAVANPAGGPPVSFAELAGDAAAAEALKKPASESAALTPMEEWRFLGKTLPKVGGEAIVTGAHLYPSDMTAPGMLYGAVVRPPAIGATLASVDLSGGKAMPGVKVARDGNFLGVAAPSSALARRAAEALAERATWNPPEGPAATATSGNITEYLKQHANPAGAGGGGRRGGGAREIGNAAEAFAAAEKKLEATYEIAYIQHAPMEPRAALAKWDGDAVTVWTGTQQPARVVGELSQTFRIPAEKVRVIVPDTGGGFGGKHTGETAVEAARLAKAAGAPVQLRWTREEEFMWAYFRPAGVIEIRGGLDAGGNVVSWDFTNYHSGGSALASPYELPNAKTQVRECAGPLRVGSYRALASTANVFARESFMDELAAAAGADPLEFRLKHLKDERLRAALIAAAEKFGWGKRKKSAATGFGLACGIEKGSYAAACAEIEIEKDKEGRASGIKVIEIVEAYECGKILNPGNLTLQVEGAIIMGLGGALTEAVEFENGTILNGSFSKYAVPRYRHVPKIECVYLDRPDLPPVGAGETPIIPVAPAIGNAIFAATGRRLRNLPLRLDLATAEAS